MADISTSSLRMSSMIESQRNGSSSGDKAALPAPSNGHQQVAPPLPPINPLPSYHVAHSAASVADHIPLGILKCLTPRPPPLERHSDGAIRGLKKTVALELGVRSQDGPDITTAETVDNSRGDIENTGNVLTTPTSSAFCHAVTRDKLKHLYEQPKVKSFSFTYCSSDDPRSDPNKRNVSPPPGTLHPDELCVATSVASDPAQFYDDKYTLQMSVSQPAITNFPSLTSVSRKDARKLRDTMLEMLDRAGLKDLSNAPGPTEMHNLLDIVRKEQNIYNFCFGEVIRQCTIDCFERGQLLAMLRVRYCELFNRVPQHIISLHNELTAQKLLNKRMAGELIRFKDSVTLLTSELAEVRRHDHNITAQAKDIERRLDVALDETAKSSAMLDEYHDLYELQRGRLEEQIEKLIREKDTWSSAAGKLAMRVSEQRGLTLMTTLQQSERSWYKLITHFAVHVSNTNMKCLTDMQTMVEIWKNSMSIFSEERRFEDEESSEELYDVIKRAEIWKNVIINQEALEPEDDNTASGILSVDDTSRLLQDIYEWEDIITRLLSRFSGNQMLEAQERINEGNAMLDGWIKVAGTVFSNNGLVTKQAELDDMVSNIVRSMDAFALRVTGENGVARSLGLIHNPLENWITKFSTLCEQDAFLSPTDMTRLHVFFNNWIQQVRGLQQLLKEGITTANLEFATTYANMDKWIQDSISGIENDDERRLNEIHAHHAAAVGWMVQLLIILTGASEDKMRDVEEKFHSISEPIKLCTAKMAGLSENSKSSDIEDLHQMTIECVEWNRIAERLLDTAKKIERQAEYAAAMGVSIEEYQQTSSDPKIRELAAFNNPQSTSKLNIDKKPDEIQSDDVNSKEVVVVDKVDETFEENSADYSRRTSVPHGGGLLGVHDHADSFHHSEEVHEALTGFFNDDEQYESPEDEILAYRKRLQVTVDLKDDYELALNRCNERVHELEQQLNLPLSDSFKPMSVMARRSVKGADGTTGGSSADLSPEPYDGGEEEELIISRTIDSS